MSVEARKNDRGAWCVYLDGVMVSDHRTHEAARLAAQLHRPPPLPGGGLCLAHFEDEPCWTCRGYISAGL